MTQQIKVHQTNYFYTVAAYYATHVQTIIILSIIILLQTHVSKTEQLLQC